jgi:hypothetical protein
VLLRGYLEAASVLRYDPSRGAFDVVPRGTIGESQLARGFFVRVGSEVFGLYGSRLGPVFFRDQQREVLDRSSHAVLERGAMNSLFTLRRGEGLVCAVSYPHPVDVLSADGEDADFFVWLANALRTDRFFEHFGADLELAWAFDSELAFEELLARLNRGPWTWVERDSAWYGNMGTTRTKTTKVTVIESGPNGIGGSVRAGEGRRYCMSISRADGDGVLHALRTTIREELLPRLEARDVVPTQRIDD